MISVVQEYEAWPMPVVFGKDVVVTSACALQAKFIFHAAVRKYNNFSSKEACCKVN